MVNLRQLFPVSNKHAAGVFLVPLLLILVTVLGLVVCDNNEGCGNKVWNEEVWGKVALNGFCEQDRLDRFLSEQQNTLSNLGFMYFGAVILSLLLCDLFIPNEEGVRSHVTETPTISLIYGVMMFYLGFGSFIFHGHNNAITYAHDQASILMTFVILIGLSWLLFIRLDNLRAKWVILALTMVGTFIMLQRNISQQLPQPRAQNMYFVFIGILIVTHVIAAGYRYWINFFSFSLKNIALIISVVIFFIMALMVQEEFVYVRCVPESKFQKHALWHVLCSMGFFVLYLFNRADDRKILDGYSKPEEGMGNLNTL